MNRVSLLLLLASSLVSANDINMLSKSPDRSETVAISGRMIPTCLLTSNKRGDAGSIYFAIDGDGLGRFIVNIPSTNVAEITVMDSDGLTFRLKHWDHMHGLYASEYLTSSSVVAIINILYGKELYIKDREYKVGKIHAPSSPETKKALLSCYTSIAT